MAEKVVHVPDEVHAKAKAFCERHRLHMKRWVSGLILDAISDDKVRRTTPVTKKKLPATETGGEDGPKPWERPPFWAADKGGNGKSKKEAVKGERKDELEENGGRPDEGDGASPS